MSSTKIIIAGLIGFVSAFLLGWVLYGMLLSGFFEANAGTATNVGRADEEIVFWSLLVANLFYGFLIAVTFGVIGNVKGLGDGLKYGALLTFLMSGFFDFIMYATTNIMNVNAVMVDIAVATLMGAIVGAIVGWYYGRE
ncbi:MAG: hypothetical protein HKN22_02650 [Bacteroidia bacterium]|nr:hypothetical protein [Bacteroidia bacterium]